MTGQSPADGLARDSRDLTLALLAARLSELSERVGSLAARMDAAETAIGGQTSTLAEGGRPGTGGIQAVSSRRGTGHPGGGTIRGGASASASVGGHEGPRAR